ncbi:glycosyl hydrolase family 81-domain-containing protein [Pelagophyceae sp. CCMP2097]|nr:glycosyl hydrolase family 81-domain-containing protein [Pelagophyceae sp. CCMP2097]
MAAVEALGGPKAPAPRWHRLWVAFPVLLFGGLVLFLAMSGGGSFSGSVRLGMAELPPFEAVEHSTPPGSRWGYVEKPFSTNAWWQNFALDGGQAAPFCATPYAFVAAKGALQISYGAKRQVASKRTIVHPFAPDLSVGAASTAGKAKAKAKGEGAAKVSAEASTEAEAARVVYADALTLGIELAQGVTARLARGSPYVTFEFSKRRIHVEALGGVATLAAADGVLLSKPAPHEAAPHEAASSKPATDASCDAHPGCGGLHGLCCPTADGVQLGCCAGAAAPSAPQAKHAGTRFVVVANDGSTWRLYASSSVELFITGGVIESTDDFTGVFRVAILPDPTSKKTAALLDAHAGKYAVAADVTWTSRGDAATYTFDWRTAGSGELLGLALPHHVDSLARETIFADSEWKSLKGNLRGVVGSKWTFHEALTHIAWAAPRKPNGTLVGREALLEAIKDEASMAEADATIAPSDAGAAGVYTCGKRATRFATLALSALAGGSKDDAVKAALAAKKALEPWLKTAQTGAEALFVYDSTYGGVVTRAGAKDAAADFGNGMYNDHHYHYGYLIYAAAAVIHVLGGLGSADAEHAAGALAADVANVAWRAVRSSRRAPRSPHFPVARHKDWYDGHSWAAGLFPLNDGRSQESISEACHAYYGTSLLGLATEDFELRDWARLLLATEVRAAKLYWRAENYAPPFEKGQVGVVGALDVSSATWFGAAPAYAVLINALPFTAASEDLLSPPQAVATAIHAAANGLPGAASTTSTAAVPGDADDPETGPWRALLLQLLAVVDASSAARETLLLTPDAALDLSQTKAAMLYWASTRPYVAAEELDPPTLGKAAADDDATDADTGAECAENAGCFSLGLKEGACCPTPSGVQLSCC